MKFNVKLLESNSTIRKSIMEGLSSHMDSVISKSISKIQNELKTLLESSLKQEPEYISLTSGRLRLDFGISDPEQVNNVVAKLADTVSISKKTTTINNNGLSGGFSLNAIKSDDFNGIIGDANATVVDGVKGYTLPWLEWLLLRGNKVIVKNYDVKVGPNPASRTGMAVMVQSDKNWRVPPEFVGTISSNWTTRAIQRIEPNILKLIQKEIEANL